MCRRSGASETALWGDADDGEVRERYRALVNAIDGGVYHLDTDGRVVAVDDDLVELTGRSRDGLRGEHVSALFDGGDGPETDREADGPATDGALAEPGTRVERAVRTAEGGRVPCEVRVDAPEPDSGLDGVVGVVREIDGREGTKRPAGESGETAGTSDASAAATRTSGEREHAIDSQRMVTALEAAREGISLIDADGEFVYVNDAYAETFGYDPAEMVGEHWEDLGIESDPDRVRDEIIPTVREEGQWTGQTTCVRSDGETFRSQHSLLSTGDDELLCLVRDVTDRTERERELRKTERRFEAVFEDPNILVGLLEPDGTVIDINETAMEYVDADLAAVRGEQFCETPWWGEGDDIQSDVREWTERAASGEYVDFQADLTRPDGERYVLEGYFRPVTDDDGEVVSIIVSDRDVTERIERERQLAESERRYRTLVENFPNGSVGLFDEDLRYTVMGGQLLDTLDMSPEDRTGMSLSEIHPEEVLEHIEPYFRSALRGERSSFEIEYRGRHLFAHTVPVRNEDAEVYAGMLVVQDVTERREAQRELRESEAKFRMLAENLEEIVWMAAEDGEEFVYLNPAFEEVWGLGREDLYDDPLSFLDSVHPDDRERVREEFTSLPERDFDEEFRIRRPDGEVRWVHARGVRVYDEDSGVARVVGIGEDVTERVERERELEQSERRYRTLAENFPNGAVAIYDENLRFTLTRGAVLGDALPSRDRIEGERAPEVFPPDIVEDLEPLLRTAVEDGESGSDTFEFGGRHWRTRATPLRDADGEIFAGLSFSQDITEQVEREAELERALDLLERTERIADVGGWEIDPETQDVFWTDHVFDLLEVDADEEPPLDEALDMYHEDDRPMLEAAVADALESGAAFDEEVRLRTGTGELRWLRLQGVPEMDDGEIASFRGAAQDITERKEREQRLEELIDELQTSNERLEQFAYAASHDLQEPLRMVSSYLQLVEERYAEELDDDGREFIEFAVDGADRMRDMVDGLLQYSRVDTRGGAFEPVDLDAVLADVRDDLQVRIEETDAAITADALPTVEGDGGQIRQVFQNLLDNAIQYSGEGPPQIRITAERTGDPTHRAGGGPSDGSVHEDGDWWAISVSDEGIGIDPSDADRVFEVFQSLHAEEDAGTGIGLALCERIVERHGGDIWVESEPGAGSTFTFALPTYSGDSE